jgi:glutamine---fructose-6-phosphate transaminase (isomerizing)
MPSAAYLTPLLAPDSPLDARSRALIAELFEREHKLVLGLGTDDPLDPKRRRRVELTLPEIVEQPAVMRTTLDREQDAIAVVARGLAEDPPDRICFVGCGDSLAVMVAVRSWFETLLGIPCEPMQALDFAYYHQPALGLKTLVVTLSSSGTTTRTVEAMLVARARGARTLALSNTPGSPLMVESDAGILVHAQRKGWPTQASTAAMAVLYKLALEVARARGTEAKAVGRLDEEFAAVPDLMGQVIAQTGKAMAAIAEREASRGVYLYAAGGPAYASAMFGAAKIKECSPDHGLAIPLEEFHHYNSQKAGDPLFLVAPKGLSVPRARDTALEGRRWGGSIHAIASEGEEAFVDCADTVVALPVMPESLAPLVYTIPVQLFAYHVAMAKFHRAEEAESKT